MFYKHKNGGLRLGTEHLGLKNGFHFQIDL